MIAPLRRWLVVVVFLLGIPALADEEPTGEPPAPSDAEPHHAAEPPPAAEPPSAAEPPPAAEPTHADSDAAPSPTAEPGHEPPAAHPEPDAHAEEHPTPAVTPPTEHTEPGHPPAEPAAEPTPHADDDEAAQAELDAVQEENVDGLTDEELDAPDDVLSDSDDLALAAAELVPGDFARILREQLRKLKPKVLAKLDEKIERKQAASLGRMALILSLCSLLGFGFLLTPLVLGKKYPGQGGMLFRAGALAGLTFFVAINLFAGTLLATRAAQGALGRGTNPQVRVLEASFDILYEKADEMEFGSFGADIMKPTLDALQSGDIDEPLPSALVANIAKVAGDAKGLAAVFSWIHDLFKSLNGVMGYLPLILSLLAVTLYLLAMKPTLVAIMHMPGRIAAGEGAKDTVRTVMAAVRGEIITTIIMIVVFGVVLTLTGYLLGLAVRPAVEVFLSYLILSVEYMREVEVHSGTPLFVSLFACIAFLALNVVFIILSSTFFIGKMQKILRERFVRKVPLGIHKRFFLWGTMGLLLNLVLPVLFVIGALQIIDGPLWDAFTKEGQENWTMVFISGPLLLVLGFLLVFWIFRGLKALGYLLRYNLKAAEAKAAGGA